jgi:hypothetical protein
MQQWKKINEKRSEVLFEDMVQYTSLEPAQDCDLGDCTNVMSMGDCPGRWHIQQGHVFMAPGNMSIYFTTFV